MNKVILGVVLLAIIAAVFLSGCTGEPMKDCGSDSTCFEAAIAACERAKVRTTDTDPSMGGATVTVYGEVRGGTVDSCTVYMKIEDFSFGQDVTPEEQAAAGMMKGADMTCTGPIVDGRMDADPNSDACTGSLVDIMNTFEQYA